jgi:hypothetical protein
MKPSANDWKVVAPDLEYSDHRKLYWVPSTGKVYDERSARHNGLIGAGAQLRALLQGLNS